MGNPPSPSRITLGRLIRFCRDAAGRKQSQLAEALGYSVGWLSNVETGQLRPRRDQVAAIEEELTLPHGTLTDVYDDLLKHESPHPVESFDRFRELERSASVIHDYEALTLPGLLQTRDTAQALLAAGRPGDKPDVIDELVNVRMRRQEILDQGEPPILWAILDETVIRRPIGGSRVHAAQLDHLLDATDRPGITVQVIPLATGAHAGLAGTFYIFSFRHGPDIAYAEDPATGHIHERPELVRAVADTHDAIRASVLPATTSIDLIKKVREEA